MQKSINFNLIRGMQKDTSVSKFSSEYMYDAQNIRLTAREGGTLLSITNEKGNKEVMLKDSEGYEVFIAGTVIGYNIINQYIVLFTTENGIDRIIRLEKKDNYFEVLTLFYGNLGFNSSHPVETLGVYEGENVIKVYWVDGINQPRVINIIRESQYTNSDEFNFVRSLSLNEDVDISKDYTGNGIFQAGIVQYAISYYSMYGQQSNIAYTSPLIYITSSNKALSPEDTTTLSINISIDNSDTNFEYIRIYSIYRTSIDATPTVKIVGDYNTSNEIINIVDNNEGSTIDPTELLYMGGENIIAGTMCTKDNTLFLGNIKLTNPVLSNEDKQAIRNTCELLFGYKQIDYVRDEGYYPNSNVLNNNSRELKGFKGREYYRFGIQGQYKNGRYSEVIDLGVKFNTLYPYITEGDNPKVNIPCITFHADNEGVFPSDWKKIRLVMVSPSNNNRSVVAQGIVCPTLYNMYDRCFNIPHNISSWFMRSMSGNNKIDMEYRHNMPLPDSGSRSGEIQSMSNPSKPYILYDENSTIGYVAKCYSGYQYNISQLLYYFIDIYDNNNNKIYSTYSSDYSTIVSNASEYVDPDLLPSSSEWLSAFGSASAITVNVKTDANTQKYSFINKNANSFYVDQSIVTFHTPDIDNLRSGDDLKFRIVGYCELSSVLTDYTISAGSVKSANSRGVLSYDFSKPESSKDSIGLINAPLFNDVEDIVSDNTFNTLFAVYPWHRDGSLNSDDIQSSDSGENRTAVLQSKIISNLRFAYNTKFFGTNNTPNVVYESYIENNSKRTGITPIQVFNSNEQTLLKIDSPEYSDLDDLYYYGNLDKVIVPEEYPIYNVGRIYDYNMIGFINAPYVNENNNTGVDPINIAYKSSPHAVFAFNYTYNGVPVILPRLNGMSEYNEYMPEAFNGVLPWTNDPLTETKIITYWQDTTPENPKSGEYWYSPSVGYSQLYNGSSWSSVTMVDGSKWEYNSNLYIYNSNEPGSMPLGVMTQTYIIEQGVIEEYSTDRLFLYIGELYRDLENPYRENDDEISLSDLQWIPITESFSIGENIMTSEGDTYFQRWDCLKTIPYSTEHTNSVVDITSLMIESRINLGGRYDNNIGNKNNTGVSTTNFNLFNSVYDQSNNFFNYRILDNRFANNMFPTQITWSQTKSNMADIDIWTNITLSSMLELDGDKGEIEALRVLNNNIYCFQDKGLSNILFNSRVQIPSSDGVPIEITNGLRVDGKVYISNTIGCNNKWSICVTPSGIYFIDNQTNGIYLFNGSSIESLSDKLGFRAWIGNYNDMGKWNPESFSNFITYYDRNNNDVYFTNGETSLVYSELLQQFTSFMNYGNTPAMFNVDDDFYAIKSGYMWKQFSGDYNMIFGEYCPYSITFIVNPDEPYDKIFNTIEFRADSWNGNTLLNKETFDTLDVWNEYQHGTSILTNIIGRPSPLKKKFRIWRANIPRDNSNNRDRIRNTWAYVKLSKNTENIWRTEFHDMTVYYFI